MGAQLRQGFTIIEVMLFFAITGALMLGVLGSASVGVNTQRYSDAVNTFAATIQQEFTKVTNVVSTKSTQSMCTNASDTNRGISNCVIIGRIMTIDDQGQIISSNLIGDSATAIAGATTTEIELIASYAPKIDTESQEKDQMSWSTKIQKASAPGGSFVTLLILRSPTSGSVYSYVNHGTSVVANDADLEDVMDDLVAQRANPRNSRDQHLCVDRSGWVVSPTRVIKLAPYASGPSGVSTIDESGSICA